MNGTLDRPIEELVGEMESTPEFESFMKTRHCQMAEKIHEWLAKQTSITFEELNAAFKESNYRITPEEMVLIRKNWQDPVAVEYARRMNRKQLEELWKFGPKLSSAVAYSHHMFLWRHDACTLPELRGANVSYSEYENYWENHEDEKLVAHAAWILGNTDSTMPENYVSLSGTFKLIGLLKMYYKIKQEDICSNSVNFN